MMTYGSVCSGIEAASVAWEPLGLRPAWFAEIEPFPRAVLAHRWPQVMNLGDMTMIAGKVLVGEVDAPDILVGGTPCQAFSIAGARAGLADPRGQLTLAYVDLANAIDTARRDAGKQPVVTVWENVPGVLSSKDNAFGCFLGALAGEDCALEPAGGKWTDAGCVFGPQRAVAWRVLDAQYFGLAQRRRRVFVVASARSGFDPCAVLFESEGVRRDSAPRRDEAGGVTPGAASGAVLRCGCGYEFDDALGAFGCPNCGGDEGPAAPSVRGSWWDGGQVSQTLDAVLHKGQTMPEKNRFPAVLVPAAGTDTAAVCYPLLEVGKRTGVSTTDKRAGVGIGGSNDPMYTLQAGAQHGGAWSACRDVAQSITSSYGKQCDNSKTALGPNVAISVSLRGRDGGATAELGDDVAGCLRASSGGGDKPHALVGAQHGVALAVSENQRAELRLTDYVRSVTCSGGSLGRGIRLPCRDQPSAA